MWKKEQPIKGHIRGCAFNPVYDVAPMGMLIAVGFGQAFVTKDGMKIWNEENIDNPEDVNHIPRYYCKNCGKAIIDLYQRWCDNCDSEIIG